MMLATSTKLMRAGSSGMRASTMLTTSTTANTTAVAARALHQQAKPQHQLVSRSTAPNAELLGRRSVSFTPMAFKATAAPAPAMFCMQCEQTQDNKGCDTVGVCGKTPEVAALQDLLLHAVKGIGMYANRIRTLAPGTKLDDDIDRFPLEALFSTLTNVNFDAERFVEYLRQADAILAKARKQYEQVAKAAGKPVEAFAAGSPAAWRMPGGATTASLVAGARDVGVLARKEAIGNADYFGLQEMIMYGLKGMSAYTDHCLVLGYERRELNAFVHECLDFLTSSTKTVPELLGMALKVGEYNLKAMGLLDEANTTTYGTPAPTKVRTSVKKGKCIAVSGHDLKDLEEILKQTEGKNINVYTHGELLPAHGYPGLKAKYPHLVGNYGSAWQMQKLEFAMFPGPIVMTTNCIVEPRKTYKDRIFTRSVVGFPGVKHIKGTDFSEVVKMAQAMPGFLQDEKETFTTTGFGRAAILGVAPVVIDAVKAGKIKHFFLIGGCDGAEGERNYFRDIALNTPKDTVILTLACGKYRFNKFEFGDIGGIPRMLDMGQCNDAYGAVQVAVALTKAFDVKSVNDLPLSFVVSWFEQKAVAVLLTLLHLGIKNIRLGPQLPAFATPNMLDILVKTYNLKPIGDVKKDMADMMNNK